MKNKQMSKTIKKLKKCVIDNCKYNSETKEYKYLEKKHSVTRNKCFKIKDFKKSMKCTQSKYKTSEIKKYIDEIEKCRGNICSLETLQFTVIFTESMSQMYKKANIKFKCIESILKKIDKDPKLKIDAFYKKNASKFKDKNDFDFYTKDITTSIVKKKIKFNNKMLNVQENKVKKMKKNIEKLLSKKSSKKQEKKRYSKIQ